MLTSPDLAPIGDNDSSKQHLSGMHEQQCEKGPLQNPLGKDSAA